MTTHLTFSRGPESLYDANAAIADRLSQGLVVRLPGGSQR